MNPQDRVVHNYVDRALEPDPTPGGVRGGGVGSCQGSTIMDHNFPMKLHYMLSSIEGDGQSNVVSWQPHGRCFMVHDLKEFVASMLPLWFRQSKHASFQRQLNLYGFRRLTQGRDKGGYYHELFLRSRPQLTQQIVRTKVKGKGARKASSPETEPRLYDFPWMPETQPETSTTAASNSPIQTTAIHNAMAATTAAAYPDPLTMASWANPAVNLGDPFSFFRFDQAPQAATGQPSMQQQHEQLLLPRNFPQEGNSLISSSGSRGSTSPSAAASSLYVPIAPAPPTNALKTADFHMDPKTNGSVLAALKVQHIAPATAGQGNGAPTHCFPNPAGPLPF